MKARVYHIRYCSSSAVHAQLRGRIDVLDWNTLELVWSEIWYIYGFLLLALCSSRF
jgi:hypothetical protein